MGCLAECLPDRNDRLKSKSMSSRLEALSANVVFPSRIGG